MATRLRASTAAGLNRRGRFLPDFGFGKLIRQGPSQELHSLLNRNAPLRMGDMGLMDPRLALALHTKGSRIQYGWDMADYPGSDYQAMLEGSLWSGPDGDGWGVTPSRPQASGSQMDQGLRNPLIYEYGPLNLKKLFRQFREMGL